MNAGWIMPVLLTALLLAALADEWRASDDRRHRSTALQIVLVLLAVVWGCFVCGRSSVVPISTAISGTGRHTHAHRACSSACRGPLRQAEAALAHNPPAGVVETHRSVVRRESDAAVVHAAKAAGGWRISRAGARRDPNGSSTQLDSSTRGVAAGAARAARTRILSHEPTMTVAARSAGDVTPAMAVSAGDGSGLSTLSSQLRGGIAPRHV